ncbi:MAG TPA: PDZ domain-containing protein, partial [Pirellulaceae bacterium]|nr:PDZ domain-containing protein [Pirellulaceae bacterium]
MRWFGRLCVATVVGSILAISGGLAALGQEAPSLPEGWTSQLRWRAIGPANMSGRITAIAVYEKDPYTWWAATASGGLIKTTNNGMTFVHQFDDQPTVSIGDVQVAQSDANIVWVGTGEANPRNSVSWGDGVYKSTDGGKTWKNMGLPGSYQIGRIAIHPNDPNIVYVGALGRLWGPNEERGLYKTTDGGETWERVLYVDDKTGVIDVQMNPHNPDELIVATYERLRDGFDGNDPVKKYGEGSAIYRTRDAGQSFEKLTQGLPTVKLGRVGLEYYRADPKFIYAIIETEKIGQQPTEVPFLGITGEDAEVGAKITDVTRNASAANAGVRTGDIVLMVDDQLITKYDELVQLMRNKAIGDEVKWKVIRNREPVEVSVTLAARPQGAGGRNPFTGTLGGQAENVQDQQGPMGFEYGGIYRSSDGGDTWERINTLNPRPMYYSQIRVDPTDNSRMYCLGTSLYRSFDGGTTFRADGVTSGIHVDFHALWIDPQDTRHMIIGNDGGVYVTHDRMASWDHLSHVAIGQFYHVGVDTRRNYRVYGGLQDNGSWGGPHRVGNGNGPVNTDWFSVGGGDGFVTLADPDDPDQIYFESQNGGMGRINLRTGERGSLRPQQQRGLTYRFDWKTPFILSPHNSRIFYSAGNYVFRSVSKGDAMQVISPEITNTNRGAGSALSESPLQAGVIYAGTNDGAVWVTRDGGQNWTAIYSAKEAAQEPPTEEPETKEDATEPPKQEPPATPTPPSDPISGQWTARATGEQARPGLANFEAEFTLQEDGSVVGKLTTRRGDTVIDQGKFNRETGELTFAATGPRGESQYKATLKDGALEGTTPLPDGETTIAFRAERNPPSANDAKPEYPETAALMAAYQQSA